MTLAGLTKTGEGCSMPPARPRYTPSLYKAASHTFGMVGRVLAAVSATMTYVCPQSQIMPNFSSSMTNQNGLFVAVPPTLTATYTNNSKHIPGLPAPLTCSGVSFVKDPPLVAQFDPNDPCHIMSVPIKGPPGLTKVPERVLTTDLLLPMTSAVHGTIQKGILKESPIRFPKPLRPGRYRAAVGRQEPVRPLDPSKRTFMIESIDDSGAGKSITSFEDLLKQGVPRALLDRCVREPENVLTFDCSGGELKANLVIGAQSHSYGKKECFVLKKGCPNADSMGETIHRLRRAHIWLPDQLPWYCTDVSKLRIECPLKYRLYADRVENFVPVRKEETTFSPIDEGGGIKSVPNPRIPGNTAMVREDSEFRCIPCLVGREKTSVDDPLSVTDVLVEGSPDEIVADPTVEIRTRSARQLILDAQSADHLVSHYPHNPMCEICCQAHLKHQRYSRQAGVRSDDGLPAIL